MNVELADNAGFGERDSLLLHRLVDRRPVVLQHVPELVNALHATVSKWGCLGLQEKITPYLNQSSRRLSTR